MDPVIVMVGRVNEGVYDIEIMPDIPANDLADAISQAFGWRGAYDIQVEGKHLSPNQSLAEAGIWDGAHLLLIPSSRKPVSKKSASTSIDSTSVTGNAKKGARALQTRLDDNVKSSQGVRKLVVPQSEKDGGSEKDPITMWRRMDRDATAESTEPSSPVIGWKLTPPSEENKADDKSISDDQSESL